MNESQATSLTLLQRVQARQPAAWERFVDLYAPLVLHWCRRGGLSTEDAADVFQEVFRSVAEHIADFRRDRASDTFRGWLRTITRNKMLDHFRRSVRGADPNKSFLRASAALRFCEKRHSEVTRRVATTAVDRGNVATFSQGTQTRRRY